jgi:hypothetical protein
MHIQEKGADWFEPEAADSSSWTWISGEGLFHFDQPEASGAIQYRLRRCYRRNELRPPRKRRNAE